MLQTSHVEKHFTGSQALRPSWSACPTAWRFPLVLVAGPRPSQLDRHRPHRESGRDRGGFYRYGLEWLPRGLERPANKVRSPSKWIRLINSTVLFYRASPDGQCWREVYSLTFLPKPSPSWAGFRHLP